MESDEGTPGGSRRPKVLTVFLVVLGILWGVSYFQIRDLKEELTQIAEDKIREYAGQEEGDTLEVAVPVVTVSKQFILFGKTTGKIAMYMRPIGDAHAEEHEELKDFVITNQDALYDLIFSERLDESEIQELLHFGGHGGSLAKEDNLDWAPFVARVRERQDELPGSVQSGLDLLKTAHDW